MNYDTECYVRLEGQAIAVRCGYRWPSMYLLKSESVPSVGKPKNVVTESYAETAGLKVWTPSDPVPEATEVKLRLCFLGEDRYDVMDSFVSYIYGKVFEWWDTTRMRKVRLLLKGETKPEEHFKGSIPYVETELSFHNVDGSASVPAYWTYSWNTPVAVTGSTDRRNKTVRLARDNGTSRSYSITSQFNWNMSAFPSLTNAQYGSMSAEAFSDRLEAFNGYVLDAMASAYTDFVGNVKDITDGCLVHEIS